MVLTQKREIRYQNDLLWYLYGVGFNEEFQRGWDSIAGLLATVHHQTDSFSPGRWERRRKPGSD